MKKWSLLLVVFIYGTNPLLAQPYSVQCICSPDQATGSIEWHWPDSLIENCQWWGPDDFSSSATSIYGLETPGIYTVQFHFTDGSYEEYLIDVGYCFALSLEVKPFYSPAQSGYIEVQVTGTDSCLFTWAKHKAGQFHILPETQGPVLDSAGPGYYAIAVESPLQECRQVTHAWVEDASPVATHPSPTDGDWQLYPNPATQHLQLRLPSQIAGTLEWVLFDSRGQRLMAGKMQTGIEEWSFPATKLLQLRTGTYLLQIKGQGGIVWQGWFQKLPR